MKIQYSKYHLDHFDDTVMAVVGLIIGLIAFLLLTLIPFKARGIEEDFKVYPGTSLSPSEAAGLQIINVDPGSIYESMDLQSGDVLLEINQRRIEREKEIDEIFRSMIPGTPFEYRVRHNGRTFIRKGFVPLTHIQESVQELEPEIKPTPNSPFDQGQPLPNPMDPVPPASARPPQR